MEREIQQTAISAAGNGLEGMNERSRILIIANLKASSMTNASARQVVCELLSNAGEIPAHIACLRGLDQEFAAAHKRARHLQFLQMRTHP